MKDESAPTFSRWQVWVGVISVAIVIQAAIVAYTIEIADIRNSSSSSLLRLQELERRSDRIETENAKLQLEVAQLQEHQTEIETQLHASDVVRNLMHASDMRLQAILWEKAKLGHLPTDNAYYPLIAQQNPPPGGNP